MHNREPFPRVSVNRRIVLRRLSPADLPEFQAYRNDPNVGIYQDWTAMAEPEASAFLAEMSKAVFFQPGKWFQAGIADGRTNALIGDLGICVASREEEAKIGFALRAQSQGLGLGTEAVREAICLVFEHTAVPRVIGITDARNLQCIRLLERLGMELVETQTSIFRGQPCVEHVFAPREAVSPILIAACLTLTSHPGNNGGIDFPRNSNAPTVTPGISPTKTLREVNRQHPPIL
jgi:RimJ/RimL family protein N-acetyltransferase